jgi:two-component system, NtrC family, sensor kinase
MNTITSTAVEAAAGWDAHEKLTTRGFTFQRALAGFSVVLSLTVLGFLLITTLSNPVQTGLHVVRLDQLDQAAQAGAELGVRLDQSRLDLEAGAQDLEIARNHYDAAQRALTTGQAGLSNINASIDDAVNGFRGEARDRLVSVDAFIEELNRLSLLFASMRSGGIALLATPYVSSSSWLSERIVRTIEEATAYSIRTEVANADALDQLVIALGLHLSEMPEEADRASLIQFIDTVDSLRYTRDALDRQRETLAAERDSSSLNTLYYAYQNYFNSLQNTARRHRQTLAVYSVALLIAFGLIAVRLRASFSALDSLNAELQNANVNLEQIVEERTEDLSQALQDLRTQQAQLIQSEKMASLGQMVAGVAHEINTPLGYASSNVEIIRDSIQAMEENLDQETREEFDMLLADAQYGLEQIGELVMSLKNFSRVDRSQTELFNVNEGLDTSLKICHNQLKEHIQIERHYGEVPEISCAPSQLNQIFLNLINNAAQAIEGDGVIAIGTSTEGDDVLISIRDTGCGMDEETRAHIFEPFFTTKPVGEGTGLGLSIVFRIIEDHHGQISVDSALGKGTEFTIRLPIAGAKVSEQATVTSSVVLEEATPA